MARFVLISTTEIGRTCDPRRRGSCNKKIKRSGSTSVNELPVKKTPKKLAALILEINFILEAKELRLTGKVSPVNLPSQAISLT